MPVTRSQRYSSLYKTQFHKLVDGPVASELINANHTYCKHKVLPTESKVTHWGKFQLGVELLEHYYDPNVRETDDISSWDQISLVTEYTDNLTGKMVLRLFEGRYVRQKPIEYSQEEYFAKYKKKHADRLKSMEGRGRTVEWYCNMSYFHTYSEDHLEFQDW